MARLGLKKKTKQAPAKPETKRAAPSVPPAKTDTSPHKFTPRQALFMDHWMVCRNATEAAKLAGFSKKTAYSIGQRLLKDVEIKGDLDRRVSAQREKIEVNSDWVIRRLAMMANANMADYMRPGADGSPVLRLDDISRDQAYALDNVTVEEFKDGRSDKREVRRTKFALVDRVKSLELLGKHLKLFTEVHEHNLSAELTAMGLMLREIDKESRAKVIEHQK